MKITTQWARDEEYHLPFYRQLSRRIVQTYALTGRRRLDPDVPEYEGGIYWSRQWEYPWAVEQAQLQPSMKVLDVGCGLAPFLVYLGQIGCKAYGSDPGYEGQDGLWGYQEDFGAPHIVRIQKESMSKMSWDDESFDRIFCLSVLEHIDTAREVEDGVTEMYRILAPSGKLIVTMDAIGEWERRLKLIIAVFTNGHKFVSETDEIRPDTQYPYNILGMVLEK